MLEDKIVVIVAGSSGIGLEVARLAVERKAAVTITGRNQKRLEEAAISLPGPVTTAAFDATDRRTLEEFFRSLDKVDHLVSCFGDTTWGGFLEVDEQRAREVIEHKFWAQLSIVRAAYRRIAPTGSIVLTGGTAMDRGALPYGAAYSLTGNTMVEALVRGLCAEVAPIRINVVEPGVTRTPLFASMRHEEREQMYTQWAQGVSIHRVPEAQEVALSYIHLMESSVITGDRIRPDGGPKIR